MKYLHFNKKILLFIDSYTTSLNVEYYCNYFLLYNGDDSIKVLIKYC